MLCSDHIRGERPEGDYVIRANNVALELHVRRRLHNRFKTLPRLSDVLLLLLLLATLDGDVEGRFAVTFARGLAIARTWWKLSKIR